MLSRKTSSMRMWDKIFTIFQTESAPPPNELCCDTEQDGFQRFMKEYGKQQGTTLSVVRNGSAGPHIQGATRRVGNRGCSLRVVWQFYRWLYRHSAWASRVRLSDAARQERSIMVAIARRFPDRFKVIENAFAPPEKKEGRSPDSES